MVKGMDIKKAITEDVKVVLLASSSSLAPTNLDTTAELPTEKEAINAYKSPKNCIDMPAAAIATGETLPSIIISTIT